MTVEIVFDKPRQLRYDLAAIKDLENALGGEPLGKIVSNLGQMGINALTMSLWAGLKHEDRTLTPNLVTKLLEKYLDDGKSLKKLMTAVNDAIDQSGLFKSVESEEDEAAAGNAPPERALDRSAGRSVIG